MAQDKITACPHCGSENAYQFRVRHCYIEYLGEWGEAPEGEVGHEKASRTPVYAVCIDCGKRVPVAIATGGTRFSQ